MAAECVKHTATRAGQPANSGSPEKMAVKMVCVRARACMSGYAYTVTSVKKSTFCASKKDAVEDGRLRPGAATRRTGRNTGVVFDSGLLFMKT